MNIMGELALIFGVCLVGVGVEALLPVAFPASVVSLILLMLLLFTGVIKEGYIRTAAHFLTANMAFFFLPSFVGMIEHVELIRSYALPLILIVVLTTPVVYLAAGWTVRLLMIWEKKRKGGSPRA